MINKIRNYQIIVIVVTILVGSALHFVYEWSGKSNFVGFFGAVNESTWEHLKIAFWPTFIFSVIGWFIFRKDVKNYCLAQAVAIYTIPLTIIILFYGWLLLFPDNFIYDISIFIFAIILAQYVAYKVMLCIIKFHSANIVSSILVVIAIIIYSLFTYFPPKNIIFLDPVNGDYGIEKSE